MKRIFFLAVAVSAFGISSCKKDKPVAPAQIPQNQQQTLAACTTPPKLIGVVTTGGLGVDQVSDLKLDVSGNLLVSGSFEQTVDFNPGIGVLNLTSPDSRKSLYTQKFSPSGTFVSAINEGVYVPGLTTDRYGCEYLSTYEGDPGINNTKPVEHFVIKRKKADPQVAGRVSVGTAPPSNGWPKITLDKNLNVFVTSPDNNIYKFNPSGKLLWKVNKYINRWSYVKVDNSGVIYELPEYGAGQLAKYDKDGNRIWGITLNDTFIGDATNDADGNTYITGSMKNAGDVDPGPGVYNLELEHMYLLKLDQQGKFVWAVQSKGPQIGGGRVLVDATGTQIVVAGQFSGTVDFGIGTNSVKATSKGYLDTFVMLIKQCKYL